MVDAKAAFKFKSKHLGRAFYQVLLDLGFKERRNNAQIFKKERVSQTGVIVINRSSRIATYHQSSFITDESTLFQLEEEWTESIVCAKKLYQQLHLYERGEWMYGKNNDTEFIFRYKNGVDISEYYYLDGRIGGYGNSGIIHNQLRRATTNEIKKVLTCHAARIMYPKIPISLKFLDNKTGNLQGHGFLYNKEEDKLYASGDDDTIRHVVYHDGEWAQPNTNLFDYETEVKNGKVEITNSLTLTKDELNKIRLMLDYTSSSTTSNELKMKVQTLINLI